MTSSLGTVIPLCVSLWPSSLLDTLPLPGALFKIANVFENKVSMRKPILPLLVWWDNSTKVLSVWGYRYAGKGKGMGKRGRREEQNITVKSWGLELHRAAPLFTSSVTSPGMARYTGTPLKVYKTKEIFVHRSVRQTGLRQPETPVWHLWRATDHLGLTGTGGVPRTKDFRF